MALVPTFHTQRLTLRELIESDAPAYQRYFVNYEVIRHLAASVPWPYPPDGVLSYIRSDILPHQGKDRWVWAITLRDHPEELIGAIELLREATPTNRGFWLGETFWGKGYMTEAVQPITDYAFEALGFESLIFGNAVGNQRSARIKEKSSARYLRTDPARYVDPALSQRELYELTKDTWIQSKPERAARV